MKAFALISVVLFIGCRKAEIDANANPVCDRCGGCGIEIVAVVCDHCNGTGYVIENKVYGCIILTPEEVINNLKHRPSRTRRGNWHANKLICPGCNGHRKVEATQPCHVCGGQGWTR